MARSAKSRQKAGARSAKVKAASRSAAGDDRRRSPKASAAGRRNRGLRAWTLTVLLPMVGVLAVAEAGVRLVEGRWWRFASEVGDGGVTLRKFEIATVEEPRPDALVVGASDAESAVDPSQMSHSTVNAALPGLAPALMPLWVSKLEGGGAEPRRWVLGVSAHAFLGFDRDRADADQVQQIDLGLESVGETVQIVDLLAQRPQRIVDRLALVRNRVWTSDPLQAIDHLGAADPAPPAIEVDRWGANGERWAPTFDLENFTPLPAEGLGTPDRSAITAFGSLADSLNSQEDPLVVLLPTTPNFELVDASPQFAAARRALIAEIGEGRILDLSDMRLGAGDFSDANHFSRAAAAKISARIDERLGG